MTTTAMTQVHNNTKDSVQDITMKQDDELLSLDNSENRTTTINENVNKNSTSHKSTKEREKNSVENKSRPYFSLASIQNLFFIHLHKKLF
jgi:hypothetical protein